VKYFLARSELLVEGDCRFVAVVSLDVDDPSAALLGNLAQTPNQRGSDSLSAMRLGDSEVVDVDLASRALELVELLGNEPADDFLNYERDERDHMFLLQQSAEIRIVGWFGTVRLGLAERMSKHRIQLAYERHIARGEPANGDTGSVGHTSPQRAFGLAANTACARLDV